MYAKFKHYLRFNDLPNIGKIEISEPFKFDGSSITVEQEKGRSSRNVLIFNADTSLELNRSHFEQINETQIGPDGVVYDYATQGFDYLLLELKNKGWELSVDYILDYNGLEYTTGSIDGLTFEIRKDKIIFNIVANTLLKRININKDIVIDVFSDKDLEGNTITPAPVQNIFLKAKPILQKSSWNKSEVNFGSTPNRINSGSSYRYFNIITSISNSAIKDTLTPFENRTVNLSLVGQRLKIIRANTNLSNVKVVLSEIDITLKHRINSASVSGDAISTLKIMCCKWNETDDFLFQNYYTIYEKQINSLTPQDFVLPNSFNFEFPTIINQGEVFVFWFEYSATLKASGFDDNERSHLIFNTGKLNVSSTSTAISTIVQGIRLKDLLMQQAKAIGFNLTDNVFVQPEYYNNFVFNGRMLGNLTDLPFNTKFKDVFSSVCDEAFADYQINTQEVVIDKINNFYKDVEIAEFTEIANIGNSIKANENFAVKEMNIAFKNSSSDRTGNEDDTTDDVHTSMQLNFPTNTADGVFNINFNHIRSAQIIEEQRRRANEVEKKETQLENDEKLFIIDCIELVPNTINTFSAFLEYQIIHTDNQIKIISNGAFKWSNIGLSVGQTITVTNSTFASNLFQVAEITGYMITLSFLTNTPTSSSVGQTSFNFSFQLTGVNYTNRTNEGFELIEGVNSADNYSNLMFSLKRIVNKWQAYLGTFSQYLPNKEIKVTEIKVNNKLITKEVGGADVIDFAPILTNDVTNSKLFTGRVLNFDLFAEFDKMVQLVNDVQNVRGYLKINTINGEVAKGFVNKISYNIKQNKLNATLYEKYESRVIELSNYVNEIDSFEVVNGYVSIFNSQNILLFQIDILTNFAVNNIIYTNDAEFTENLLNLLQ